MTTEATQKTLTEIREAEATPEQASPSIPVGFGNSKSFALTQRIANCFSSSDIVPKSYQGKIRS